MNRMQNFAGGRPFRNEDVKEIQSNLDLLDARWAALGPFVVSGCEVTQQSGNIYDLAAGVVYLNGKLIRVTAQAALDLSAPGLALGEATGIEYSSRPYDLATNNQDSIITDHFQITPTTSAPAGQSLFIRSDGMRTMREAMQQHLISVGEIRMYSGDIDTDFGGGLGLGVGQWRGWTLCNGQLPGIPNLTDRFIVGADISTGPGDYAVGDTGGVKDQQLTAAQIPDHTHVQQVVYDDTLTTGSYDFLMGRDSVAQLESTGTNGNTSPDVVENRPPYYALAFVIFRGTNNTFATN